MIPELGSFSIIIALCFSLTQGIAIFFDIRTPKTIYAQLSSLAVIGQFLFLGFAMLCLIASFLMNDMTVIYVREHSHQLLPFIYRVGAAWGGHEGSLLLWCLILSGWTLLFMLFSGVNIKVNAPRGVISMLGFISAGFILFLFATSNPFTRDFPNMPVIGDDLTPVLQDPGLIFHPPMLYLGYVGFAIGFAYAICALIEGKFDQVWARACQPWVILPWSFLSCGIVLGSWWAYRELGWGGWWAWDPVENASLLPWLSATALIHTLIVCEKRDVFKGWAILLAIVTFTLSLLGTFLVRSGILVSVHAFANDPTRGIYLLSYLTLIIGGAFVCYAYRIKHFYQTPHFKLFSRETFLLLNSVILLSAVATILIGTLYPIILDALNNEKISVGEPYFNTIFAPMMLPLLVLMGIAPHVSWDKQSPTQLWKKLRLNFLLSVSIGFASPWIFGLSFYFLTALGVAFALWLIDSTLQYAYQAWKTYQKITLRQWGMIIAHLGIAVFALGVTVNKSYSEERQVKILPGETITLAAYQFTLTQLEDTKGPNYQSVTATFAVQKNHHESEILSAEQRIYLSHEQTLSKPGILVNPWRDLYLTLGSPLPGGAWSVRLYYKPFIRWIWFGGAMLLIGGLLSLLSILKNKRSKNE